MAKGGRKVYRQGQYAKKQRIKKIFGWFFGIIIFSAVVFVGYSVAVPIYNYIKSESIESEDEEPPWTPPVFTEYENEEDTPAGNDKEQNKDKDKTDDKNNEGSAENDNKNNTDSFTAFELPADALLTETKLGQAVTMAKEDGFNAVVVIMKAKGGKINYKTASTFAASDKDAVKGTLEAEKIAEIIKSSGLKAIAYVNILEDNNRYGEGREGSYHSTDGSTWLDNNVARGGKPWLSPFETKTQTYAAQLSAEVASAGFDTVIAGGVRFPNFRNSDLNLIGDKVKSNTRYQSLLGIVNVTQAPVIGNKSEYMLEVSASGIIKGTEEVFKPDKLMNTTLVVTYTPADFEKSIVYNNHEIVFSELGAASKFAVICGIISDKAGADTEIIPLIKRDDYTPADFNEVVSALIQLGYKSYIVR